MKNKYYESLIRQSKVHKNVWANRHKLSESGFSIPYLHQQKDSLSWWEETYFIHGSHMYNIEWIHPRMSYQDKVRDLAHKMLESFPRECGDIFSDSTPIYRRLGKSKKRKRVTAYRTSNIGRDREMFVEWDRLEAELLLSSDIVIRPWIKIMQYRWGKCIYACFPFDVNNIQSAEEMSKISRDLALGTSRIRDMWPDYTYTSANWVQEKGLGD